MNNHNCNNPEKWIDVLRGVQIRGSSVCLALTPLATTGERSVCGANVRCRGLSNDVCAPIHMITLSVITTVKLGYNDGHWGQRFRSKHHFSSYLKEQLVLSVAERVFPWLTYITK
ncbi:hypothetical protein T02_16037 [Trichinella nativa]|uniref:Uncharacterized protein n=1 Tax=Trichinella nativa TaxID=6335 RepID=A0A0V1LKK9_9BILA|nr:hypothetical protein T02_16037 [Trichinella nativa]